MKPDSIRNALASLTRAQIETLDVAGNTNIAETSDSAKNSGSAENTKALLRLGLIGSQSGSTVTLNAVTKELRSLASKQQSQQHQIQDFFKQTDISAAITQTQKIVLLWRKFFLNPAVLNQSLRPSSVHLTQLANDLELDKAELDHLYKALQTAGFLEVQHDPQAIAKRVLAPSADSYVWVKTPHAQRWLKFAEQLWKALPSLLKDLAKASNNLQTALIEYLAERPFLTKVVSDSLFETVNSFEILGMTKEGNLVPAIKTLFSAEAANTGAESIAATIFPETVAGVIVQPDFSVIAPGLLDPQVGLKLLDLTEIITPGLATTMQITKHSLEAALRQGWDPTEILAFLRDISVTELPQPLVFMIKEMPASDLGSPNSPEKLQHSAPDAVTKRRSHLIAAARETLLKNRADLKMLNLMLANKAKMPVAVTYTVTSSYTATGTYTGANSANTQTEKVALTPLSIGKERLRARDDARERELNIPLKTITDVEIILES